MKPRFRTPVCLLLVLGCKANSTARTDAAARGLNATSVAGPSAGATLAASTAASVAVPAPSTSTVAPTIAITAGSAGAITASNQVDSLPDYPPLEKRLSEPCNDPRAVLAVRKNHDRSGRYAVQAALVANPQFKVVPEKARAPFEVDFYETIYGTKNFARKYPDDPMFSEAVIGRCADVSTCNRLAAMFHAAFPAERIDMACGVPPKTTGGFARVAELAPERLVVPTAASSVPAHCARAAACLARERSTLRVTATCAGVKAEKLKACGGRPACSDVVACIAEELR